MRLVEWNIGLMKNKCVENIANLLELSPTPDLIVLTEVKAGEQNGYIDNLRDYDIFPNVSNVSNVSYNNCNDILIGVKNNIEKAQEIKLNSIINQNHPDWRMVQLSYGEKTINLLGLRFKNHKMNAENKKVQLDEFYRILENESKPDIIIGDFNVGSALSGKGIYWSQIKKKLLDKGYRYYDATSWEATFSYQHKKELREKDIGSSPDNIFLNIQLENNGLNAKKAYYHWGKGWNTDHAMLIVDFEMNSSYKK